MAKDEAEDKMAVTSMLESMWLSGDLDDTGCEFFVKRQAELWEQWGKAVKLITELDQPKVIPNNNGFRRFGKECWEFCFLYHWQIIYYQRQCWSFDLRTLLRHAGDYMSELHRCYSQLLHSGRARRGRAARPRMSRRAHNRSVVKPGKSKPGRAKPG